MSNRVDVILAFRCISDRKRNVCTRIKIYFSNLPIRNYRFKIVRNVFPGKTDRT